MSAFLPMRAWRRYLRLRAVCRLFSLTPRVLLRFRNWGEFLLHFGGIRNSPAIYTLRSGYKIATADASDTRTIVGVLIEDEYGAIGDNKTIIDIGANIGVFAVHALSQGPHNRVFSYEPFPEAVEVLQRNIHINRSEDRARCFPMAVGARSEERVFYFEPGHSAGNTLYPSETTLESLRVPGITLEQVLEENQIERCDLLKMDCEGAEYEILLSATDDCLARIDAIRLEYHVIDDPQCTPERLIRHLDAKGFRLERHVEISPRLGLLWYRRRAAEAN